jgi:hypothetical protein
LGVDFLSLDGYVETVMGDWRTIHNIKDHFTTLETARSFVLGTKFIEWNDTIVNILTGNSVILLHFWHHATIVLSSGLAEFSPLGLVIGLINSFIHVFMYLYYALSTFKFLRPYLNSIKILITLTQIIQFIISLLIGFVYLIPKYKNIAESYFNPTTGLITGNTYFYHYVLIGIIFSYLLLFLDFYRRNYMSKKKQLVLSH